VIGKHANCAVERPTQGIAEIAVGVIEETGEVERDNLKPAFG
jgi:hypothetical protein